MEKNEFKYLGQMNDPTSSAFIKGPCGDEMEFYLVVEDGVIRDIKFYTKGCGFTRVCGETVACLALHKTVYDALAISPSQVMSILKNLPEDHRHCSILSVSTLYRAIADYLLQK
jgi:nitrogen fixation NifU-like protein